MGAVRRGLLALVVGVALLVGGTTPALSAGDSTGGDAVAPAPQLSHPAADDARPQISIPGDRPVDPENIELTQEFRLTPSDPGEVTVRLRFAIPGRIRSLHVGVPDRANVSSTAGFDSVGDHRYRWDGTQTPATLTYDLPVNASIDATGPKGAAGNATAVDAGDWALFQRPRTPAQWNYTGAPVSMDRTVTTAGPGASGEWLVYLGPVTVHERRANGQQIRLAVPDRANTTAPPREILDSLTAASDALRVGDRDASVFVVAAPTGEVSWGVRGLQTGDADFWVRDVEPLADPDNVWVHEYVHTRQEFSLDGETRWFEEATAAYYAALLTFEQERIEFDAFRDRLARGERRTFDDAVLANASTWERHPAYHKGALVAGQLDRAVRQRSDRERSLQTVVRDVNARSDRTGLVELLSLLGENGGTPTISRGQRYVATPANVSMWNQSAHAAHFGQLPARIGYDLPPPGDENASYRVAGPYRQQTLEESPPITIGVGERLRATARVSNDGGTPGEYRVPLAVDGRVVDRANGTVEAGETASVPLEHTFETPGRYDVGVDGENVTVVVEQLPRASVVDLSLDRTRSQLGGNVTATAAVRNERRVPAVATVVYARESTVVGVHRVTVPPNATLHDSLEIPMHRPGTVPVSAGDQGPIEVWVSPPPVGEQPADRRAAGTSAGGDGVAVGRPGPGTARSADPSAALVDYAAEPDRQPTLGSGGGAASELLAVLVLSMLAAGGRDR